MHGMASFLASDSYHVVYACVVVIDINSDSLLSIVNGHVLIGFVDTPYYMRITASLAVNLGGPDLMWSV